MITQSDIHYCVLKKFVSFNVPNGTNRKMILCRREAADIEFVKGLSDTPHEITKRVMTHDFCSNMSIKDHRSINKYITRLQERLLGSNPQTIEDINFTEVLKTTLIPQNESNPDNTFLFYDSFTETQTLSRFFIFSSCTQRHIASKSEEVFGDGTYRITPNTITCLYTLHSLIDNTCYPIAFLLLPNDTEETFVRALKVLKPFLINVKIVHCDCQISALNAFSKVLGANIKLCLFHLNQAVFRMLGKKGLSKEYIENAKLHLWVRRLFGLPFLPKEEIHDAFEKLFIEMST
ncbi:hypothetical protein EIN_106330, partial [Entamoeba invadens IP1]